jgi:hypothetical protein
MFFKELEGEAAVLVDNGVYKQVPLFSRNGYLYAKTAGGFVRLMADGSTTKARMRLDTISVAELAKDSMGRLCQPEVKGSSALPDRSRQALLGTSAA